MDNNSLRNVFEGRHTELHWIELQVTSLPEAAQKVKEIFARFGDNQGVVIEKAAFYAPDGSMQINETAPVKLKTYLPLNNTGEAALKEVQKALINLPENCLVEVLKTSQITSDEWSGVWREFTAQRISKRTVVVPPWEHYEPQTGDIVIALDPNKSFGMGQHPTTGLCLGLIEEYLDPSQHLKVLDLGTGSGILAIQAGLLGVHRILALDADPIAVKSALQNTSRNGLSQKIRVEAGSIGSSPTRSSEGKFYNFTIEAQQPPEVLKNYIPFDLIVANLYGPVLISLTLPFAALLRKGGIIISSGIKAEIAGEVAAAYVDAGFEMLEQRGEDGWVGFAHRF